MDALKVFLGATEVGVLEHFEDESQRFTFAPSYVSAFADSRPVLGQIFEDRRPHAIDVGGPMGWFSHLLPQGVMRRWRARLLGLDEDDAFGLLKQLGEDMPGAVVLTPGQPLLSTSPAVPATEAPKADSDDGSLLKFSLAGAQWKLSARSSGRGLTTRVETEGTACIAKFHAPEYPGLPCCEFATMNWARLAGLNVPRFELRQVADFDQIPEEMPTGDGNVYVVERFDRAANGRIHMEDFAQILDKPPSEQYKGAYEEIAAVLRRIAPESAAEFLKLTVFNILCGNGDAHLKNFSVLYPDGRNAVLSLAYDLVSTVLYYPPGKEGLALKLNGEKLFQNITWSSFDNLLDRLVMSREVGRQILQDAAEATLSAWNFGEVRENYTQKQQERLEIHIRSLSLV